MKHIKVSLEKKKHKLKNDIWCLLPPWSLARRQMLKETLLPVWCGRWHPCEYLIYVLYYNNFFHRILVNTAYSFKVMLGRKSTDNLIKIFFLHWTIYILSFTCFFLDLFLYLLVWLSLLINLFSRNWLKTLTWRNYFHSRIHGFRWFT